MSVLARISSICTPHGLHILIKLLTDEFLCLLPCYLSIKKLPPIRLSAQWQRRRRIQFLMEWFAVIACSRKVVLVFLSFLHVPGVALCCTAVETAKRRTGKPTTSSAASQKLTEHQDHFILRALRRNLQAVLAARAKSAPYA
jgi:hypothetical protein